MIRRSLFNLASKLGVAALLAGGTARAADVNWPVYLGDAGCRHYSSLKQINKHNVDQLHVAWTYLCGDVRPGMSEIECNPLIINGVLYATTCQLKLVAVNAATGRELWRFDPFANGGNEEAVGINRGVSYWADGNDRRILFSASHYLYALDAGTGRLIKSFGTDGRIDLKEGLGRDVSNLWMVMTSPVAIFKNLFVLSTRVGEGPDPAAPGDIRAYDIRSGKMVWIFHTIPHPGELGYDTWPPDAWTNIYVSSANCWAGMAVDERRGIVYVPTGSATFDYWGGNRIGKDLFSDCLLALDAQTGHLLWYYQFVHHDMGDHDLPAPPTLLTVTRNGHKIDAVAEITKYGYVYVFNRVTGEPLFPIREVQVPPSDLEGESVWPTQPLPVAPAPYTRQEFSYKDITDFSPQAHRAVLDEFVRLRPYAPFNPPSTRGTIVFPGFDGGGEWGGAAADPNGVLYVNENEMPWIISMRLVRHPVSGHPGNTTGGQLFTDDCAACHGKDREGNAAGSIASLVNIGKKMNRAQIAKFVQTGGGMMPGFGFLLETERGAIADFLLGNTNATASTSSDVGGGSENVSGGSSDLRSLYVVSRYTRWFGPDGYPAIKPPWGTLNAIDLNTGNYLWRVPLGEYPALVARGIPPTGTENYGGPLVTAGGLVFIGASRDEMFRAFDQATGKILWQTKLPAAGYATPATYAINGRQYVVIACGGGKSGTKSGDAYVAFELPKKDAAAQSGN